MYALGEDQNQSVLWSKLQLKHFFSTKQIVVLYFYPKYWDTETTGTYHICLKTWKIPFK